MNNPATFGPHNPHPLSQMKTELVWEGKYDEFAAAPEVKSSKLVDRRDTQKESSASIKWLQSFLHRDNKGSYSLN